MRDSTNINPLDNNAKQPSVIQVNEPDEGEGEGEQDEDEDEGEQDEDEGQQDEDEDEQDAEEQDEEGTKILSVLSLKFNTAVFIANTVARIMN